jgi:hypothetical protein
VQATGFVAKKMLHELSGRRRGIRHGEYVGL